MLCTDSARSGVMAAAGLFVFTSIKSAYRNATTTVSAYYIYTACRRLFCHIKILCDNTYIQFRIIYALCPLQKYVAIAKPQNVNVHPNGTLYRLLLLTSKQPAVQITSRVCVCLFVLSLLNRIDFFRLCYIYKHVP